jgi:D-alanyl-D-alanine carboxypeptidase/D-alanyl-D-alanine-endopeptidase (penicillin-binding protein 4)
MPRALLATLAVLALLAPAADAQTTLTKTLSRSMAAAGHSSGAYVMDADSGAQLFSYRANARRVLASNTKLFTSAATLGKLGPDSTIATTLLGSGSLAPDGTWNGNLYLRGGGDPTFGSATFSTRGYGSIANVEALAAQLANAGFTRVTGRVYGDESLFDTLRGGPDSGYRTSSYVGPLSALDFNHGYGPGGFLANPALYAAQKLNTALEDENIAVRGKPTTGAAPGGAVEVAEVRSPTVTQLLRLQNKDSDNFFAEMLAKGLAVSGKAGDPVRRKTDPLPVTPTVNSPGTATPAPAVPGPATTKAGTQVVARFARTLGATPRLVDGSGLARGDQASPRSVAMLLDHLRDRPDFSAIYNSLPIAGRDGTLDNRMRRGPARNHCHAKTGTLTGVSALSGYCSTPGGHTVVFSILMNGVNVSGAHVLQDRMVQAIAAWRG